MEYDTSVEYAYSLPVEIPIDSTLVYAKLKTVWPVGIRDFLMFTHVVKHKDECWFQGFSAKHESCPVPEGMIRINVEEALVYFQPNSKINGYNVKVDTTFCYGGSFPDSVVAPFACSESIEPWVNL